ncbi:MAG: DUF6090 family protein [Psychroserpens sp.]|uniref:DUF6090 family protein n=1 Tax=Psychroserpens sp. TaxID=2020870 RepID=UPI0030038692
MEKNKTGKYFKYAIGEIILVVIGILIALGINNWNENRKNSDGEFVLLQKLKEENSINIESMESDIVYRNELPNILQSFNSFLKTKDLETNNDSLQYYLSDIFRSTSYTFTQSNLINYINLDNSKFSELNKELSTLQSFQKDIQIISEKGIDIKIQNLFQVLKKDVDFNSLEISSYETLKSLEFRNDIIIILSVEKEVTTQFNRTLKQMQKVDSLILQRLKN